MKGTSEPPRANVFGMITTSASAHYTPVALRSFFAHTPFGHGDKFVLVDNDGDFVLPADLPASQITIVRPTRPQGFARNANALLAEARALGADLFLLNNDLVFTSGWLEPLLANRRALLSPLSNAELTRSAGALTTRPTMDLDEYVGREADLEAIAAQHRSVAQGYRAVASVAFFCIKIPRAVYEVVGDFDEQFGKGGGEDRDYAVRAWIAGIPQEYAMQSYVLHFQGKSTWRGPETPEQQSERDRRYTEAFHKKWGPALTYAFLGGDWNLFRSDRELAPRIETGDFTAVVRRLRSRPSLEPHITRQRQAQFAAVCCIYDDDSWLAAAVESVYDACDSIWFLVGERPWNGAPTDQTALVDRLRALPDPANKIRIVRGQWPDEASQRNEGLRLISKAGADYCFVLDADEIYDPEQLRRAMALVRENPQVDCWRASCFTYWKSYRYRVDPPEAITATVFVRTGTGRFVENRTYQAARHANLALDTLVFHHMSYARSDEQILRKITTFGHARDVVPGWYENVWRRWDTDRSLENLNPCWPGAYRRIVEQPYAALPPALRRIWNADEQQREAYLAPVGTP
jgi:GT2 family glycosyltransferase/glycosyltransferase involved in cell wall biosynthesis